jgi:hypothetical protein
MVRVAQNPKPYFTVSSETPPTWRARFPHLYPPGTEWPSYTLGHWVPFTSPLTTRRATVEVFEPSSYLEGQVPVFIYPRNRMPQLYPRGSGFPLRRLLLLAGLWWRYCNPRPTWRARSPYLYPSGTGWSSPKPKSRYNRWLVSQNVLVSCPLGIKGVLCEGISITT